MKNYIITEKQFKRIIKETKLQQEQFNSSDLFGAIFKQPETENGDDETETDGEKMGSMKKSTSSISSSDPIQKFFDSLK